jgi:3-oxoacyl-[acyl-carrier-protein] synthase II
MRYPFPEAFPAEPRRVVVTGTGLVTALGTGWRVNADRLRIGIPGGKPVSLFDTTRQRVHHAAEAELLPLPPATRLSPRSERRLGRASRLLIHAAHEAWQQSGWDPADRLPVVLGTTSCGMESGEAFFRAASSLPPARRGQPTRAAAYQAQRQGTDLSEALGFRGPVTLIGNACASGANAIGHAFELVRSGRADRVLTGGYDALCQLVFAGFGSLQALSTTTCRPFDARRDGLMLGEGAAVLMLESLPQALKRGAVILGEVAGYGATTDTHHLTQPHPQGDAALAAMEAACAVARIRPDEVSYINAHGTGTPLNDAAEALAINRWAGSAAEHLRVSSTKGSLGHMLGAAGAAEAVISLMALREQWLPPEPQIDQPDPACRFTLVKQPTEARVDAVLSNSFGFGGANAALIFRRIP